MNISVPDLGDVSDVEITEILVKVGDRIAPEDSLVALESEKATMDVPSPAGGTVVEIKVAVGDRVSSGDLLMVVEAEDAGAATGGDAGAAGAEPGGAAGAEGAGAAEAGGAAAAQGDGGADAQAGGDAGGDAADTEYVVKVPDLGDFSGVEVIEVLVAEGDRVEAEQGLITLETEKASMDVPSPEAGVVASINVKTGDNVSEGDAIVTLRVRGAAKPSQGSAQEAAAAPAGNAAGSAAASAQSRPGAPSAQAAPSAGPSAGPAPTARQASAPAAPGPIDETSFARAHASPSIRRLARELGVDLGRVKGTGEKGRVRADDVKGYVKEIMQAGAAAGPALPTIPDVDFSRFGEVETQPLGRIQRVSGPRLHASWVNLPHVTQHDEADITELEKTRQSLKKQAEERGIRLTSLAFVLRACALALAEFPHFRSSLAKDGRHIVLKHYTHLGFAVDTPNGLVVPVIRDADKKDVFEIAEALAELSSRARDGKLRPDDMQGGVFSVSSLGGIGGTFFTPIINAPEVAILGVSRHQWKPMYLKGGFVPRLMLPLSLSYDHRVIDGADGVRFTTRLAELLGDVERLLEAVP